MFANIKLLVFESSHISQYFHGLIIFTGSMLDLDDIMQYEHPVGWCLHFKQK